MIELEQNKMTYEEFMGIIVFIIMMLVTLNFNYSFPTGILGFYFGVITKKLWNKDL